MNYFIVEFDYIGPRANILGEDEATEKATRALTEAERIAVKILNDAGIKSKHAYAWPDGSLYRFAQSEMSQNNFMNHLDSIFKKSGVSIINVHSQREEKNPNKGGCKTLKEYMDKEE